MELRHLRYFVMAAEEANISRAAARLNISQPAVSRQIRDLEEELGVSLFKREYNGLQLTDAGSTALTHARELLRRSNGMVEALRAFGDSDRKLSLKVGFIPTALPSFLADGLRKFNRENPNVCVQIHEMSPTEQEEALRREEIDLALLGQACPELKKVYRVRPIRKTPLALALPDDHPLAGRKALALDELAGESFLSLHEKHFPGRPEMMREMFERAKIHPEITLKANGLSELLGLVGGGAGVALVPAEMDLLPHARVVFVKLSRPKFTLMSSAVWRKESESEALLALVDAL